MGASVGRGIVAALCLIVGPAHASAASPRTYVVCPAEQKSFRCQFRGDGGIQAAIDRAADGDTILIKAGRYAPVAVRDTPYKDFTVRSYLLIQNKSLSILGEPGTILDGSTQKPATALTINRATVTLRNLEISGFRWDVEEDDFYDGHGVFVIDGRVRIENVTIRSCQKMGLTGRGSSMLEATNLHVVDGHVGLWLHETAYLRLSQSIVRGNVSGGLAAYDDSVAHIANSVFDGNLDDGLYTEQQATLYATDSLIVRNKPLAAHALGDSTIRIANSALFDNASDSSAEGDARIRVSSPITQAERP